MRRILFSAIAIAAVATLPACGSSKAAPTGSIPAAPSSVVATGVSPSGPSAPPSPSSSSIVREFSVDGAGPYELGDKLTDLQTTPGLASVTSGGTACPQDTIAQATGSWQGVSLTFDKDGVLVVAVNRSTSLPTPSGAYLGTPLAKLKTIYANIQTQPITAAGGRSGFLVTTVSGGGILFDLNAHGLVQAMAAGDSTYLMTSYQAGPNFC